MRKILPYRAACAAVLTTLAACSDGSRPVTEPGTVPDLTAGADAVPTRRQQRPGTFLDLPDNELWRLIENGGRRASVGLRAPGKARGVWRGQILIDRATRDRAQRAVLAQPGVSLLEADDLLPRLQVRVDGVAALAALRRLPMVDYVEPVLVKDELQAFGSIGGCGWGTEPWSGDRQYTSTRDVYSQKFTAMNIPAAWSLSSGAGMTIGLTDTGLSSVQGQFTTTFSSGWSTGRTVQFLRVPSQPSGYDSCGHGTRMAGIIAAPWDGENVGGIAYRANLISVRQADGVGAVSSSDAAKSVRTAVSNGSRIVVMAWESLNWWWEVSDEIEYWHYSRPVLFVGAAGTSGCGDGILDSNVIFPADMPEVMAVTGITYPGGGVPCGIHRGSDVELTAYLDVPTTGRYTWDVVGMGGSSNATAVVGGIAALAWARSPGLSRDQLRARLQQSGAYYPSRHAEQGFGLVNALKAVRGY